MKKQRTAIPTVTLALPILGLLLLAACSSTTEPEAPPPDPCEGLPQVADTVTATMAEDPPEVTGKIVFSAPDSTPNPQDQLFVMNADGSGLRQITRGDGSAIQPAWSPDGQTIAYAGDSLGSASFEALWLIEADGSDPRPVRYTSGDSFALMGNVPDWHPDGDRLAFDYCIDCEGFGLNYEIYTIELENGITRNLTEHTGRDQFPTWSPDGEWVAFTSNRDYYQADSMRWRKDLYWIRPDGTELKRLTCTGHVTRPTWSPDGSKIAYVWNIKENEVFLYDVSTQNIINLDTGLKYTGNPIWNSDGSLLMISGRETEEDALKLQLLKIENQSYEILQTITPKKISGDYDWYSKN
jgi:TolB protein